MSFRIGETVGDYRILEEIGSGGGGCVFKVEHTITRRREAMKVLAGSTQSARESFLRFLREIRLQAALTHPNIAEVYNAFWTGEHLVMVMELLDGAPLEKLLAAGRMPLEDAAEIARQVLNALAHAHSQGVVHRDVSPSNIFVTRDKRVKLTDFGLAAMVEDLRVTQNGGFLGSFHYMSPEQVRSIGRVDARSDIYSCGVVLYEMVTGRKPFNYDNAFSLMQAQVEQAPLPPLSFNPNIPHYLNDVILRAMEKDPANRFPTAAAFRDALDVLDPFALCLATAGVPEEAAQEPEIPPVSPQPALPASPVPAAPAAGVRRSYARLAVTVCLGAALALAAGFASFNWLRGRGEQPPAPAVPETYAAPPIPSEPLPPLPEVRSELERLPQPSTPAAPQPVPPPMQKPERNAADAPAPRNRRLMQDAPEPPATVHNALPPEPPAPVPAEPEPDEPLPMVLEPPPAVPVSSGSFAPPPPPTPLVSIAPPPPPAEKPKAEQRERPRGLRGFFGRLRGKPAEKPRETGENVPASKP